jgi:peptidoglycan-N-acetylglucosamine deacetylase
LRRAFVRIGLARTLLELALVVIVVLLLTHRARPSARGWSGNPVYSVPTHEKVVALTYDDGPHPTYTPEILDVLDRYHVKATFFMIGQRMENFPDLVEEVAKRGHAIGNHTYTHPRNLEKSTPSQVIQELEKCEEVIERLTGHRAKLFRPPRGMLDGTVLTISNEEGYQTILWSVSADHHDAPTPKAMAARVLGKVHPGSIILAHDGTFPSRIRDVEATSLIIAGLQKRGYHFVTVPELLGLGRNEAAQKHP